MPRNDTNFVFSAGHAPYFGSHIIGIYITHKYYKFDFSRNPP